MAVSQALRIQRVALSAGVRVAVKPLAAAGSASIGNATAGDLTVFSNDDESEFLVLATGYERSISIDRGLFNTNEVAFWLTAAASGTAVILWT